MSAQRVFQEKRDDGGETRRFYEITPGTPTRLIAELHGTADEAADLADAVDFYLRRTGWAWRNPIRAEEPTP